jgi:subtilisin family serine protease
MNMNLRHLAVAIAAATASAAIGAPAGGVVPFEPEGTILAANTPHSIPGSYIVVLKDTTGLQAPDLSGRYGGSVKAVWKDALNGFAVTMTERAARRLAADPAVKYVEQDQTVSLTGTQSPTPSWGLDRIDQRALPLNNSYTFPNNGAGVTAYIIDTGIRITHVDFGGRASVGFDAIGDGQNGIDCHGHGTHVAGTVGGSTYGVAKGVNLVAVRVLNCSGSGTNTQVINGINFVTSNHTTGAAVANMSLGGGFSQAENDAVTNSINDGVTYAIAAGNSNANACNFSPASTPAAVTVGATDINDNRASFSNFGTCLDIFAPGVSITSDWGLGSDTATNTISGTSMATPHVAGVAALIKAANPSFTPQQVRDRIVADSTANVVVNPGTGSPNRLLFVNNGGGTPPTTVFSDNFETSLGWTTNPNGTDTATTGMWERGDPEATSSGVALQLGTTVSGTNDLVTARLAGASVGVNDVDSGVTSVRSPSITLPTGTLTVSYSWYLAHLNNATSADFFRVSIVTGSGTTVLFTQAGSAVNRAGAWGTGSNNISSFGGQSVRILFECADASTASLIECGVDDVVITKA